MLRVCFLIARRDSDFTASVLTQVPLNFSGSVAQSSRIFIEEEAERAGLGAHSHLSLGIS